MEITINNHQKFQFIPQTPIQFEKIKKISENINIFYSKIFLLIMKTRITIIILKIKFGKIHLIFKNIYLKQKANFKQILKQKIEL